MNKDQIKAKQDKYNLKVQLQKNKVKKLIDDLIKERSELYLIESNICFFQFENHKDAEDKIEERLHWLAQKDCVGAYNCGASEYTQEYQLIDSDVVYLGKIEVQYNRHDKTYYFVDEVDYSYTEVKPE